MAKLPIQRGQGVVEWILIIILVLMVLVTAFFLLRPALGNLWREALEAIQ
ncbi:MAG: pilus assembly protein [Chloroflexota bacterium]|jgi:flagellar biosynthesis/type III secretory pathway M-ring protein FliF/YscJ|nr:pilus assembly protein [Chloroflexota bacterium]